ncbi:Mismatched base pair and cruciform DNA recognition protein, putative [Penicillium digitatum PHI26]|uniref:Mismatched base pair and cruciform DNA recognition protein, putative n=2 Tax=Penicillium digitatum TaxID=36651 RepID=K9G402_PEND2|nr:Mismatched base pair and cruciform DNA recognition protein, putative [Penicillium digitatum Pd1]EKV16099.1 Mismatched base pair and cruciform DNA recognition protein, putative [Penicillium digitatum PHI26]EKV19294.1 Mismatched base pair and cruciform DNA recognition protein, putative [Penicillium digitatum Pd1]
MSDNTGNVSTAQSYLNQATGLAQRTMGAVTGDSSTQAKGELKHEEGQAKKEASHKNAKLGSVTADPNTGAVAKDNPTRDTGSWDQTVGSAKESLGNLIGNENLRRTGVEQNAAGKEQEAKGQIKDWGEGIQNRAKGTLGSIGAAVTGNRSEEEKYRDLHDEGKVRQRGAEVDMAKKGGVYA